MTQRDRSQQIWNIPNILTMLRIAMIGLFIWQYAVGHRIAALVIFLLAGLTDFLDGFIARRYSLITDFGKLMDPLADKLMQLTALICLCVSGLVPLWVIITVAAKELFMVAGGLLILRHNLVVRAHFVGKLATVVFIVAIAATFLHDYLAPLDAYLQILAVALTLVSVVWYTVTVTRDYLAHQK